MVFHSIFICSCIFCCHFFVSRTFVYHFYIKSFTKTWNPFTDPSFYTINILSLHSFTFRLFCWYLSVPDIELFIKFWKIFNLHSFCRVFILSLYYIPYKHTTCIQRWNVVEYVALTWNIRGVFLGLRLNRTYNVNSSC